MTSLLNSKCLLIIFLIFICSCSYQLVNSYNEKINISVSSKNTELNNLFIALIKKNESYNLDLSSLDKNNTIQVKIEDHEVSRYAGASSLDGRTTRVRMEYNFKFKINSSYLKNPLIREFKESAYYIYEDSSLLSMEEEEELLIKEFISSSEQKLKLLLIELKNSENFRNST